MKQLYIILIALGVASCLSKSEKPIEGQKAGSFSGVFQHGNFSDNIQFEIEGDFGEYNVFFTSLEQNANRIPLQAVEVNGNSISFKLQSDFYTYTFKNKWTDEYSKLQGTLSVDTTTTSYILERESPKNKSELKSEEISFESNGVILNGTIWQPIQNNKKALIIVTSSGNADRSASRAEAIFFAQMGYTTFHYDKRGTGRSKGNWNNATMDQLLADDISAIKYFSTKTGIALEHIGIKGSSQGATKIPYILNELEDLNYGIAVSCPGSTLLESDLNYWRNNNAEILGKDIEIATALQRKVFEFIAGKISKADLEYAITNAKSQPWFGNVWVPNLDEVQIDKKLNYSPMPFFEKTKQPILIIQGEMDEIIPANSSEMISEALKTAGNNNYKIVLLEGVSHSMSYVGKSDFPYWSKLHPDYLPTIKGWIKTVTNH